MTPITSSSSGTTSTSSGASIPDATHLQCIASKKEHELLPLLRYDKRLPPPMLDDARMNLYHAIWQQHKTNLLLEICKKVRVDPSQFLTWPENIQLEITKVFATDVSSWPHCFTVWLKDPACVHLFLKFSFEKSLHNALANILAKMPSGLFFQALTGLELQALSFTHNDWQQLDSALMTNNILLASPIQELINDCIATPEKSLFYLFASSCNFSKCQELSKNTLYHLATSTFPAGIDRSLLAHLWGNAFICNTPLEGGSSIKAVDFMLNCLPLKPSSQTDSIRSILFQIRSFRETLQSIAKLTTGPEKEERLLSLARHTIDLIRSNSVVYIPGGWTNSSRGHSMCYIIEKKNKKYSFSCLNTGSGLENHAFKIVDGKERYCPLFTLSDIAPKDIEGEQFWMFLFGFLVFIPETENKNHDATKLYSYIQKSLLGKTTQPPIPDSQYIRKQKSGICSMQVLWALLRTQLPFGEYYDFKFTSKLVALYRFYLQSSQFTESDRTLLHYSVERLAASTYRGFQNGRLSQQLLIQSLGALQEIGPTVSRFSATQTKRLFDIRRTNTTRFTNNRHKPFEAQPRQISAQQDAQNGILYYTKKTYTSFSDFVHDLEGQITCCKALKAQNNHDAVSYFIKQSFQSLPKLTGKTVAEKRQIENFWSQATADELEKLSSLLIDLISIYFFITDATSVEKSIYYSYLCCYSLKIASICLSDLNLFTGSIAFSSLKPSLEDKHLDSIHLHSCYSEILLFMNEFRKKDTKKDTSRVFMDVLHYPKATVKLIDCKGQPVVLKMILDEYLLRKNRLKSVKQDPQYVENAFVDRKHLPRVFWDFFDLYGVCKFQSIEHIKSPSDTQIYHQGGDVYLQLAHEKLKTGPGSDYGTVSPKTLSEYSSLSHIKIPAILERAIRNPVQFLNSKAQNELYEEIFSYASSYIIDLEHQHLLQVEYETAPLVVQQLTQCITLFCSIAIENDSEHLLIFAHKLHETALSFIRETKNYKKMGAESLETLQIEEYIKIFIRQMQHTRITKETVLLHLALYKSNTKNLQPLIRALFMSAHIAELGPLRYEILAIVSSLQTEIKNHLESTHTQTLADIFSHCPFIQPTTSATGSAFQLDFPRCLIGKISLDFSTGEVLSNNRIVCPAEQFENIPGFTQALLGENGFNFIHTDFGIECDQTKIAIFQQHPHRFVQIPACRLHRLLEKFGVAAVVDSPHYLYYDSEARDDRSHPLDNAIQELPPYFSRDQLEIWISNDKTNGFIFDVEERQVYKIEVRDETITLFDLTKNRTLLLENPNNFLQQFEHKIHILFYIDNTTRATSIELPRYKLSFVEIAGQFHSLEFPGFFIVSTCTDPISHNSGYILLENDTQEQLLLIPDCHFRSTQKIDEPLSRNLICTLPTSINEKIPYHRYSKITSTVHPIQWASTRLSELFLVKLYISSKQYDLALSYIKRNYISEDSTEDEKKCLLDILHEVSYDVSPKGLALRCHLRCYISNAVASPLLIHQYKEQLSNIPERFQLSDHQKKRLHFPIEDQGFNYDQSDILSSALCIKPQGRQVELTDDTTASFPLMNECYTPTDVPMAHYLKRMYEHRHDHAAVAFTLMASHFKQSTPSEHRLFRLINFFALYILHNASPPLTEHPSLEDFFTQHEKRLLSWGVAQYKHLKRNQGKLPPLIQMSGDTAKTDVLLEPAKPIISYHTEVANILTRFDALKNSYIANCAPQEHSTPQFPLATDHSNPLTRELLLHLEKDYYASAETAPTDLIKIPELLMEISSLNNTMQLLKINLEKECQNYFDPNFQIGAADNSKVDRYVVEFLQNITDKPDRFDTLFLWYLSLKEHPQNDGQKNLVALVDQLLLASILTNHLLLIKKLLDEKENPQTIIAQLLKKLPLQMDVGYQIQHILLYFQYKAELLLTQEQFELIKTSQSDPESVFQLSCGKGKTKVLTALKLLISLLDGKTAVNIVPSSNFETNCQDLRETIQTRTPFRVHAFSFNRSHTLTSKHLYTSFTTLMQAIECRDCIITTPESLQSLELKYIETLYYTFDLQTEDQRNLEIYEKMLIPFMTSGSAVIDEVHLVLNALSKTSYALKSNVCLPYLQAEVGQALFEAIALHNQQENEEYYFPIGPRRKEPFISEHYEHIVKPKLVDRLVDHKTLRLPPSMRTVAKEFLLFDRQSRDEKQRLMLTSWFQTLSKDVQDRIMLLRGHLHIYLPHALKTPYMMKYGPATDDRETAIPYRHKGEPAKNSFFEKPEAEISYTYLLYLNKGLTSKQVHTLLEGWQNIHRAESRTVPAGHKTPISQRVSQLFTKTPLELLNLSDPETLQELTAAFAHNHQAIFEYLAVYVFPQSTISKHKITSTCHNLVRLFMPESTAFSGTPTNYSTYPIGMRYYPEKGSDGMLIHALMQPDICTLKQCDSLDPEKLAVFGNFSLQLDPQAYYDDMTNEEVIEKFLSTRSKQTLGVYFCSKTNTLVGKTADSDPKPYRHNVVDGRECIYYLDEMHCVGTDITLPTDTTALLLINKGLTFSKLTQSVKRLRKFGLSDQKVVLCIDKNLACALAKRYNTISIQNILQWTVENEAEEIEKSLLVAYQQQIHAIYRARLLRTMITRPAEPLQKFELYAKYRDLLLDTINLEQFYDDASIEPVKTSLEKLKEYSSGLQEKFSELLTEQDAILVQKTVETGCRYLSGQNEKIDDQTFDITSTQECQISLHTDEEAEKRIAEHLSSSLLPKMLLLSEHFKTQFLCSDLKKLVCTGHLADTPSRPYFVPASKLFTEPDFDSSLFFTHNFIKMNNDPLKKQEVKQDAVAHLQKALIHSGAESDETMRLFRKSLPQVRFVLVVRSVENAFFRYIVLHEHEAHEVRGFLTELSPVGKKKFDGMHIQLINTYGDDLNPSSPRLAQASKVTHDMALAQLTFLNGDTVYTEARARALKSWFQEDKTRLENKLQFFRSMKQIRLDNSSSRFERSQLAHLFDEAFQQ